MAGGIRMPSKVSNAVGLKLKRVHEVEHRLESLCSLMNAAIASSGMIIATGPFNNTPSPMQRPEKK